MCVPLLEAECKQEMVIVNLVSIIAALACKSSVTVVILSLVEGYLREKKEYSPTLTTLFLCWPNQQGVTPSMSCVAGKQDCTKSEEAMP